MSNKPPRPAAPEAPAVEKTVVESIDTVRPDVPQGRNGIEITTNNEVAGSTYVEPESIEEKRGGVVITTFVGVQENIPWADPLKSVAPDADDEVAE